jgi:biotin-(acetyl-CoA carboxylase) ligase
VFSILDEQATSLQTVLKNKITLKNIEIKLSELIIINTLHVLNSEFDNLTQIFNSNMIDYNNQISLKDGSVRICKGIDIKGNLILVKNNHKILLSISDSDELL